MVAHFDGRSWEKVKNPLKYRVLTATLAPDGALWVSTYGRVGKDEHKSELYRRAPSGEWKEVRLPDGVDAPTSLVVTGDGTTWFTSGKSLYRSLPSKSGVQRVDWQWLQQFPGTVKMPKAANDGCKSVFVMMYGMTRVTPKDYDFPMTRQAIKGHTELKGARFVETEENGKRYFGAFVPSLALGKKLEKLVRDKVKGSLPAVLCHEPKVLRELEIDLTSGEVVKHE